MVHGEAGDGGFSLDAGQNTGGQLLFTVVGPGSGRIGIGEYVEGLQSVYAELGAGGNDDVGGVDVGVRVVAVLVNGGGVGPDVDELDVDDVGELGLQLQSGLQHVTLGGLGHQVVLLIAEDDVDLDLLATRGLDLLEGFVHQIDGFLGEGVELFGGHVGVPHVFLSQRGKGDVDDDHHGNEEGGQKGRGASVTEFAAAQKASVIHISCGSFLSSSGVCRRHGWSKTGTPR